jgi:hypothetical protein
MGELIITVLALGLVLGFLILVMVFLSWRADHAVAISGPLETLSQIEARIAGKQAIEVDLEAEVQKRREALADFTDKQAEIDALLRQKDELLVEWNQLEERRSEILGIRAQTEEKNQALIEVSRDLTEKAVELEAVEQRLKKAEALIDQIEDLRNEAERHQKNVDSLREDLVDLRGLREQEQVLRDGVEKLTRDIARLEGEFEGFGQRRQEAEDGARQAENRLDVMRTDHIEQSTKLEAARTAVAEKEHSRANLMAQIENLESQIEAAKSRAGVGDAGAGPSEDRLADLKALPPVLLNMKTWPSKNIKETESQALHNVKTYMESVGLSYHSRVIRAFHTAMKVNETTQMAVLAGISGTGKSQLPRRYAQGMGIGFLQVPVQPRWDSPQDLMGFYNYIEGKFRPTDMARALYHLDVWNSPDEDTELKDRMLLILLDEMNLARVEYYFSDFLSRLESRPIMSEEGRKDARKDAELELDIPMPNGEATPRIYPGYNLLFAGTMNEDESTQSLSDKVLDRANVMRFAAPKSIKADQANGTPFQPKALSRSKWQDWVQGDAALGTDRTRVLEHVEKMAIHMRVLGKPFGHRLGRAIMAYAANYPVDNDKRNISDALADQVELRLLPKLRGIEIENTGAELRDLADYIESELNDSILAEGIRDSLRLAEEGAGQFVWRGVSRG